MSDTAEKQEPSLDAAPAEGETKKSGGGNTILLIVILVLVLALGGGVGFLLFTEKGKSLIGLGDEHKKEETKVELPEHLTYYEIPEMLVNVQSTAKRKPYLRVTMKLEIHNPDDVKTLDLVKPRIIDAFQVYLRELRVEDLEGAAGSQRLRQELLKRANAMAAPAVISNVLFETFVVQ